MKHYFLSLALVAFVLSTQVSAQTNNNNLLKEVLTNNNMSITWLGADFSRAKILDNIDCDPVKFATEIVPAINNVIIMEPAKYDFGKFLMKKTFITDIQAVTKSNASMNPGEMMQNQKSKLDESTIKKIVAGYDLKGNDGIGVVLIYESLSKLNLFSSMYLTYIKMPEGEVIVSKPVTAKPGGFGLRNFWAATVYDFLKDYNKIYLKSWKAEYGIQ